MPDYGHPLEFGVFLPPAARTAGDTLTLARLADRTGLDLVSVQDHPYQAAFLDAWTLLSVIAAATDSVRVFPNVANLPLRPPAVLARSAASLDILSGGRVELGLGAGSFWDAIEGIGGPRRTPGESVAALAEAIDVIRALWTPGRRGVRLDGEHYRLAGAHPGPPPAHDIGIWLGAYKKRMLALTGRTADGWLPSAPYAPPEQLAGMNEVIDEAAESAGRSPSDIRRLYNIVGSFAGRGNDFLRGPAKVWVEQLAELALADGVSGFVLMVEPDGEDDLRRFAEEVAPGVRELVAQERALGTTHTPAPPPEDGVAPAPDDGVAPTPDDGVRLSTSRIWDESTRPVAPEAGETAAHNSDGEHLIQVHDHLRAELERVRSLVEQVAGGRLDVGAARSEINEMTMRQNNWTLGAYCESYCRVVTMHHSAEDQALFPRLRRADPRLAPVIDRLAEEHRAIHDVLNRVDAALVAMVRDPSALDELSDTVDLLTDALLSHLSYEERSLVGPMSRLPLGIA